MSRHWREILDPAKHTDWMSSSHVGGMPVTPRKDSLIDAWAYFVEVRGFRFEFASLNQVRECLAWFSLENHGSNRDAGVDLEHYWQHWHERLPEGLLAKPNRQQIVKALREALADFDAE